MPESASEQSIFLNALALPASADRAAYLDEVCRGNAGLRAQLDALLAAHERLGGGLPLTTGEEPAGCVAAESPPVPGSGVEVGDVLSGRYKLVQQIGEGGMGTVWMAQQQEPVKRLVALKVIKPGMDSKQVLARFEAERQALALMDHPNIARVLDAGTTATGHPFFVMELVKGVPLTKYCDEHRLTPKKRLELFIPICQAIQHAHQKGVIHRDIKPSNVLVALYDGQPVPKVIDFGIAKATGQQLTEHTLVTGFGTVVGTLEYMSPEQAELNQLDIDTRSDIYSLGVLLYELLTGSTPLEKKRLKAAALLEVLRVIREEEPPRPSTRLSDSRDSLPSISALRHSEPAKLAKLVRGELDWIVMKALDKDRNRRYETANGFAADIQRYLADEPVQACPPSAWYRFRKFTRRNKGPVLAAAAVLVALLAGILGTSMALVWALRERDDKGKALVAEIKEREHKEKALAAETAARLAEKQARDQALTALRDMTDEIVERQMARGHTLTNENKEFLRRIIKQFEGFAAFTADDADSRAIRAEGYHRVGLMRYRLGELKDAESAFGAAVAIWKQLAADFPTRPEYRHNLAESHLYLGALLRDTGRVPEAELAYGTALTIQKQLAIDFPTRPEFRQALAISHTNLGNLLSALGRLKAAETAYADALALNMQLAADLPTRPEIRQHLALSHNNLGTLFRDTGRWKEAETAFAAALAIYQRLDADFPARPALRQELARTHNYLGGLFHSTGRLKEAEAAYAAALSLRKELAADFPTRPEFRQELASSHHNLGHLLGATGRPKEAETAYADSIALLIKLTADFPNQPDFSQELAGSYNNLGSVLQNTGRLKEAATAYAGALAVLRKLAAESPNQPDLHNKVAGTCVNLAILELSLSNFRAAKRYLEEAAPHHDAALKANPRNPMYRQFYANNLGKLIQANAGLGDQAGATQAAEKLRDLGWDRPANAYDAACFLALCLPIIQRDDTATKEQRDKRVEFYGDEALKMLRAAIANGYKDAVHMKQDTDLEPLRAREDFKKLLGDLEAKNKE